jgi:tetratricopeptide (TPR) repeat protein
MNVAVPLALGIAALSTLQDVVYARGSAAGLSPLTITSYVASAAALGLNISLRVAQSRHRRAFAVASRSRADPALEIQTLERAETELSQGRLADALSLYLQNARQRPDSGSLPLSLYQIARIHQLQGELDLAELELRLIVDVYPDPAVFDRSQKALADVLSAGGKYAQALEALDAMVMLDPLYVPEEIAAYRTEILERLVQTEPNRRAEIEAAGRRARGSES